MKNLFIKLSIATLFILGVILSPTHKTEAVSSWIKANNVSGSTSVTHPARIAITWGSTGADSCTYRFSEDDDIIRVNKTISTSGSLNYDTIAADAGKTLTFKVNCTNTKDISYCNSYSVALATCFIADTKVTLADGTFKNIQDVKVGDVLKGEKTNNKVLGFHRPKLDGKLYSFNGGKYLVTEEHPFKTTKGWKSINPEKTANENIGITVTKLKVGDILLIEKGKILLKTINSKAEDKNTNLYNFFLDGDHTYYADGYLVHNKEACGGGYNCSRGSVCIDSSGNQAAAGTCAICPKTSACATGYTATCTLNSTLCTQNTCYTTTGICSGTVAGSVNCDGTVGGPFEGESCRQFDNNPDECLSKGCSRWRTHGCSWVAS